MVPRMAGPPPSALGAFTFRRKKKSPEGGKKSHLGKKEVPRKKGEVQALGREKKTSKENKKSSSLQPGWRRARGRILAAGLAPG